MNHRLRAATAGAVVCCLAAPAVTSAATRDVYMGTPPSIQKTMQEKYFSDANAFFPSTTTIHVGDTVRFVPVGFHNAQFPKKGAKPSAAIIPTGQTISGEKDAAGADFWFNGQPQLGFNPALFQGLFGKSASYSGASTVDTGLPLQDKPKPAKIKFTKRGSFTYYCTLHTGMKAKVQVVASRAAAPSAKGHKAAVDRQIKKALSTAKSLAKRKAPSAGITVGVAASNGIERFVFAPDKLSVKVGDTITFTNGTSSFEVHTATTGPGDAEKPSTYLGSVAAGMEPPVFKGFSFYPSDTPNLGNATLTSKLHGNGFWNSGALDSASSTPIPRTNSVLFGEAGTYTFVCLIHPFMKATVTATA